MNKQRYPLLAVSVLAAMMVAGCAGSTAIEGVPVRVSPSGQMSDLSNQSLFTYDRDVAGSGKSSCDSACAMIWKPFIAGPAEAPGSGFSFISREDGSRQWAYQGRPIYLYTGERYSGDLAVLYVGGGKVDGGWSFLWHVSPTSSFVKASP